MSTTYIYMVKIANTFEIRLFARVLLGTLCARFTMHAAAPVKFASTLPRSCELMCVVAATTAH